MVPILGFLFIAIFLYTNRLPIQLSCPICDCSTTSAPRDASPNGKQATPSSNAVMRVPQSKIRDYEEIAEFTYKNQRETERPAVMPGGRDLNPIIARYEAQWPCFWGAAATGVLTTWTREWDKYKDGWKFTCGLAHIQSPCLVYSLGSAGNMAFEAAVLNEQPECEVHIFDKDNFGIEKWFPDAAARKHVTFHRAFITAQGEDASAEPPRRTLAGIMRELGHAHIDILKMDVEGAEFDVLSGDLPSIGQLLVEVHLTTRGDAASQLQAYDALVTTCESHGLRLFHKEVNARYDRNCVELSFIQRQWAPERKNYKN